MILAEFLIPHGHCYLWKPGLVGLHIISDAVTALAYYSIPLTLTYFVAKRRDVPFNWIFLLFSAFIISCGTTHIMEIWTLWYPHYWLSGALKAFTAIVSLYTAFELVLLLPQLLLMPSAIQFEAVKEELRLRQQAEAELQRTQIFLNSLLENLPVGVFAQESRQLRYVFWNKTNAQLLGYCASEVLAKSDYDLFPLEQANSSIAQAREVLSSGRLMDTLATSVNTHNGQRILKVRKVPIFDEVGTPQYVLGIVEDITEPNQAEESLRQSEARFQRLAENVPGVIYQYCQYPDGTDEMTYVSPRVQELYEFEPETVEPITELIRASIHPDDRSNLAASVRQSTQTLEPWRAEWRITTPAGQLKWLKGVARPEKQPDGTLIWDGLLLDISNRKQAEAALRESEERYRRIVETAQEGIWLLDAQANTTYVNAKMPLMLGYTVEEMLGRSLFDFMDEAARAEARTYFVRRQQGIAEHHDFRFLRKDGSNLWTMISTSVLLDAQGQFMGALGMVVDITERKQTEAALRESEQKFRAVFDSTLDGILIADENGCYVDANPAACALFGLPKEQIVGRQALRFTEPEQAQDAEHDWQRFSAHDQMHGEFRCHLTNSTTREVEYSVIANFLPDRHLSVFHDITERKQAEAALRALSVQEQEKALQLEQALKKLQYTQAQLVQHEKMASLGQLVAGVAHEINNPTTFIYGNIHLAREYAQDLLNLLQLYQKHHPEPLAEITTQLERINLDFISEDFPKLIASMKQGANRIKEIVLSLRNFSHVDEAECKWVDIHQGIDNTLFILNHRLARQPDRCEIQVLKEYSNLPKIECYPGQLNQVFMNVLCNAIDALELGTAGSQIPYGHISGGHHASPSVPGTCVPTERGQPEGTHSIPLNVNHQLSKLPSPIPTIRIHTEFVEGSWVLIRIADNGPGLTPEVMAKVFDPFFTTKPPGKGMGLGLSISYQIVVDKHTGQLTCHSVASHGAEFVIKLPVTQKRGSVAKTPTRSSPDEH